MTGSTTLGNGVAVLKEDPNVFTGLSQTFTIPGGATKLQFTIKNAHLVANGPNPPDAFEAALLDANTGAPLGGSAVGLNNTDSLLNVQSTGEVFFGPGVTVSGLTTSGETASLDSPLTVTIDLSGIAAGTRAALYFDLLGFGPADSSISIVAGDGTTGGGGSGGIGGNGDGGSGGKGQGNGGGGNPGGQGAAGGHAGGGGLVEGSGGAGEGSSAGGSEEAAATLGNAPAHPLTFTVTTSVATNGAPPGTASSEESISAGTGSDRGPLSVQASASYGQAAALPSSADNPPDTASDADDFWPWLGRAGKDGAASGRGGDVGQPVPPAAQPARPAAAPAGGRVADPGDDFWPWSREDAPEAGRDEPYFSRPAFEGAVDAVFVAGNDDGEPAPAASDTGAVADQARPATWEWASLLAGLFGLQAMAERRHKRRQPAPRRKGGVA